MLSEHVTDTDEAAAVIARDLGYDVQLSANEMTYGQETVIGDVVAQSSILVDAELTCTTAPNDLFMIVQVVAGTYQINPWGVLQVYDAGSAFVLPPGQEIMLDVRRVQATATVLPAETVLQIAHDTLDLAGPEYRRVAPRRVDPRALRSWATGAAFYRNQILGRPELYRDDLLRTEATRQLVASTIATFDLVEAATLTASESAAVRRARSYIDDHVREPMTINDVAHAARIGPRALQYAFQKQRAQSPMDYLRRARMAGVHTELLAADPTTGATVSAIAASWGFGHAGRFSAAYRAEYGVNPQETLHR